MTKDDDTSAISAERWMAILRYRGMDAEALLVAQRRNLKALMQASELVAKGLDEAAARQAGLMRQSLGHLTQGSLGGTRPAPSDPGPASLEDLTRQQLDYSRQTVETALTHFQELSDLLWRCNREACSVINHALLDTLQSFAATLPDEASAQKEKTKPAAGTGETEERTKAARPAPPLAKAKPAASAPANKARTPRRKE